MPILSTDIGSSNLKQTSQPGASLLYRIVDVTPENGRIGTYIAYSEPTWNTGTMTNSRVLASGTVPVALWSIPGTGPNNTYNRSVQGRTNALDEFYSDMGEFASFLPVMNSLLMPLVGAQEVNNIEGVLDAAFQDRQGNQGDRDSSDFTESIDADSNRYEIVFFPTEGQGQMRGENNMFRTIGDYAGENRNVIGVTVDEKGLNVLWTNSLLEDVGRRYARLVEDQGRWIPMMNPIGLGSLSQTSGGYMNSGVPTRWAAGMSPYLNGRSQRMQGTWHTPLDFMPYSAARRAAPYHNMWHTAFSQFMDNFSNLTNGAAMTGPEKMAMSSLVLGQFAGFGQASAVPNGPIDPAGIADRFYDFVGLPAAGSYLDFDPVTYVFGSDGLPSNDEPVALDGEQALRLRDWMLMSYTLATATAQTQCLSSETQMIFDGGPRPDQVTDRLMMAWRPDISTGSSNNPLGVLLIPNSIDGSTPSTRFPVLQGIGDDEEETQAITEASCTYTGIQEPVIFNGVSSINYREGKADSTIEEDYYMFSPVVTRETVSMELYRHRRRFRKISVPRSKIKNTLPDEYGASMLFFSDCAGLPSQGYQSIIAPYRGITIDAPQMDEATLSANAIETAQYDGAQVQMSAAEDYETVGPTPLEQDPDSLNVGNRNISDGPVNFRVPATQPTTVNKEPRVRAGSETTIEDGVTPVYEGAEN